CQPCDALVGTHHNDPDRPLGTMADKKLRYWRRRAHAVFDVIWKSGRMTRKQAYRRLGKRMGLDVRNGEAIHIGDTNKKMCKEIIMLCITGKVVPDYQKLLTTV